MSSATEQYRKSHEVSMRIREEAAKLLKGTSDEFRTFVRDIGKVDDMVAEPVREFIDTVNEIKPSGFIRRFDKDLKKVIGEENTVDFYRLIDGVREYQYAEGYYRRSFRSSDYNAYRGKISSILNEYRDLHVLGVDLCDYISRNVSEELLAYRSRNSVFGYIVAARIDSGDTRLIDTIKDCVLNDGGDVPYFVIRGIFMSHNSEMYELMEKLLLAARLQEGIRQAVCENIDIGTKEAFTYMFNVIVQNDLVRFASVQRAIETFTGIISEEEKGGDRINKKQCALIYEFLADEAAREKAISGNDHMEIYLGLWAVGTDDIVKACDRAAELVVKGNREQRLTAAFFIEHFNKDSSVFLPLLDSNRDDLELVALLMNGFMPNMTYVFNEVLRKPQGRYKEFYTHRVYADPRLFLKDREEARRAYDLLSDICNRLPKKKLEYNGIVFSWHKVTLNRSDLITRMVFCASASEDSSLTLAMAREIPSVEKWAREGALALLLNEPVNKEEYELLTKCLGDGEEYTRVRAKTMLDHELNRDTTILEPEISAPSGKLPKLSYDILEDLLRSKKSDLRQKALELLATMDEEDKLLMIGRLLADKSEEKRYAALDLIMQMGKEGSPSFDTAAAKTSVITSPTTNERVLLDEINAMAGNSTEEKKEGSELFDPDAKYEPVIDKEYLSLCEELWKRVFPNKKLGKKLFGGKTKCNDEEILKALDDLIERNKDLEYEIWGEKRLLGNGVYRIHVQSGPDIAFPELWDKFYEEHINSTDKLIRLDVLLSKFGSRSDVYKNVKGYAEFCDKYVEKFLGPEFTKLDKASYKHFSDLETVIGYLFVKHDCTKQLGKIGCAFAYAVYRSNDPMIYRFGKNDVTARYVTVQDRQYERTPMLDPALSRIFSATNYMREAFPFRYCFMERFNWDHMRDYSFYNVSSSINVENRNVPSVAEFISACARGVISEDVMYKRIFDGDMLGQAFEILSGAVLFLRERDERKSTRIVVWGALGNRSAGQLLSVNVFANKLDPESFDETDNKILALAEEVYEKVIPYCVSGELRRGDSPTQYSQYIKKISRIYGLKNFVGILKAFGKTPFNRSRYMTFSTSKKDVLSYLLGICVPDPGEGDIKEQAEKLGEMVKGTDIKSKRLIEAALFAPEWLDIVGELLNVEGFKSGCYYFMAHMNESFDDKRKAAIAKYSPISPEDFNNGAFDKNWFDEVYEVLGQKKFDEIYDAAKYISDGAKHSRARKYADAATGKLDPDKTLAEIKDKRNKDLLMAYAIIKGSDKELLERYSYIRQYIKESKNFGSQRRASEKLAGETAIKNMATAQGYQDETRFILKMENDIASGLSSYWQPQKTADIEAYLAVVGGKVEIKVVKDGKALKSVPAKLKKDELILDLQEAKKTFTEQYRRTRIMLEEAMESKTSFSASELDAMRQNPVLTDMIDSLVFESDNSFGLWGDLKVKKDADVYVAHPYSMFKAGCWREMQTMLFEKEIVQPFKQVFRELYVKTDEEMNCLDSRRYAGNQIQTKRTVAVLKNRRWIADVEEGLQKVYYKENIIATIYALADWFSPSDVEAPTLEWVAFYDRKTGAPVKIADVPDILFSEVMRDVDLAVSVAHAGEVDPEMSHSTIEMRHVIAEFTCKSFKLKNVSFTESHALIKGTRGNYTVHLGSGVIHQEGGPMINVLPVHSQRRGRIFLPFVDDDPKTSEIITKILLFAEDAKIKDPFILDQII